MLRFTLLLAVVVGCFLNCTKDITVPPTPKLIGEFEGMYWYQEFPDVGSDTGDATYYVNDSQFVLVSVDSQYFRMLMDISKTPQDDRVACDSRAFYDQDDRVITFWYPPEYPGGGHGAIVCPVERSLEGQFRIRERGDSLTLENEIRRDYDQGQRTVVFRKVLRLKRA